MRKKKLTHLSRQEEALRQQAAYTHYNKNAQKTLDSNGLLTALKSKIAERFHYTNYQTVANLISKKDKIRRKEIENFINSLSEELIVKIFTSKKNEAFIKISLRGGQFNIDLSATLKLEYFADSADFGIIDKNIKLLSVSQKGNKHFLNKRDITMITDFFRSHLIFDLIPI